MKKIEFYRRSGDKLKSKTLYFLDKNKIFCRHPVFKEDFESLVIENIKQFKRMIKDGFLVKIK